MLILWACIKTMMQNDTENGYVLIHVLQTDGVLLSAELSHTTIQTSSDTQLYIPLGTKWIISAMFFPAGGLLALITDNENVTQNQ